MSPFFRVRVRTCRVRVRVLLHYEFHYSYLLNVNTVRCFVVAVVVGVVGLWTMVMLNSQAYTSINPLPCHRVIERVDQFQTL